MAANEREAHLLGAFWQELERAVFAYLIEAFGMAPAPAGERAAAAVERARQELTWLDMDAALDLALAAAVDPVLIEEEGVEAPPLAPLHVVVQDLSIAPFASVGRIGSTLLTMILAGTAAAQLLVQSA